MTPRKEESGLEGNEQEPTAVSKDHATLIRERRISVAFLENETWLVTGRRILTMTLRMTSCHYWKAD